MSDPNVIMQRQILDLQAALEVLRKADVPPTYLSYAQRAVNPLTATSTAGDFAQPWQGYFLVFSVSVFVVTTNNGTNFWTIDLVDSASGSTIATVNTSSGVTASTWTRLADTTITQPASSNVAMSVVCTKTLTPGNLFVVPGIAVLRTGN